MIAKRFLRTSQNLQIGYCLRSLRVSSTRSLAPAAGVRLLHCSQALRAHEVLEGLTQSRITVPWIDVLEQQKSKDEKNTPKSHARDMSPRKMRDSHHRVILPLTKDKWLSDTYLNANGNIRLGALLMDLDALSGIIAYKHTGEGVTTVTAACDRINIENPLTSLCDLEYSGQVTYATGRSSMEITCKVAKAPAEGQEAKPEDVLLSCNFTMVALDSQTKKATNVPTLKLDTEEEKKLFKLGETRSRNKKSLASHTLLKQPPSAEESNMIHNIWLRSRAYNDPNDSLSMPSNVHPMSTTKLDNSAIMQPQYRNRHHFVIFGGYLMRQTYELAFSCAASFARTRPSFVSLDPSSFLNPVPVGSVLYLTATVAYTDPPLVDVTGEILDSTDHKHTSGRSDTSPLGTAKNAHGIPASASRTRIQVRVDSRVRDIEHGTSKPTGQFNYTFTVDKDVKVLPQTYQEFMMYLDARRRATQADTDHGKSETAASITESEGPRITE